MAAIPFHELSDAELAELERAANLTDDELAALELAVTLGESDLALLENSTGEEVPLDVMVDWVDATLSEEDSFYSDDFIEQSQSAVAELRRILADGDDGDAEQAQAITEQWVEAALAEWARCDQMVDLVADMERCKDPLRWRDLLVKALGLMSRRHLADTMQGNHPGGCNDPH